jgi:RsiW-degrading membrane proteinase PrsW (M82 family)
MRKYLTWIFASLAAEIVLITGAFAASSTGENQGSFDIFFGLAIIAGIIFAILFYFLPYAIARHRNVENITAVLLVNLLTGWCFLGWAAALIMATVMPANPPSRFEAFVRDRRREPSI